MSEFNRKAMLQYEISMWPTRKHCGISRWAYVKTAISNVLRGRPY